MGDAQKSAVASPWPLLGVLGANVLYFMARRWYKRASNLSQAGITISKPRKARHRCRQILGWHRFSALTILSLIEIKGRTDTTGTIFLLPSIFLLFFFLYMKQDFGSVASLCHLVGFNLNPACQLSSSVLSSSIALLLRRNQHSLHPLPQMFFLTCLEVFLNSQWSHQKLLHSVSVSIFLIIRLHPSHLNISLFLLSICAFFSFPLFLTSLLLLLSQGGMWLCGPVSTVVYLLWWPAAQRLRVNRAEALAVAACRRTKWIIAL